MKRLGLWKKFMCWVMVMMLLIPTLLQANQQEVYADDGDPSIKVGWAILVQDEKGGPLPGVSFKITITHEDKTSEVITTSESGEDGYARTANDAIQLYENTASQCSPENVFNARSITVEVDEWPEGYEKPVLYSNITNNENTNKEYRDYVIRHTPDDLSKITFYDIQMKLGIKLFPVISPGNNYTPGNTKMYEDLTTEDNLFPTQNISEGDYFYGVGCDRTCSEIDYYGYWYGTFHAPLIFVGEPMTYIDLEVEKVDSEDNTKLKDAKFEVINGSEEDIVYKGETYGPNGVIAKITTDENGYVKLEGLPKTNKSKYLIKEVKAPDKYKINTTNTELIPSEEEPTTPATDEDNAIYKKVIENELIIVEISKVEVAGSEELPGATLKITDENEALVEQWVSTTESKKINLSPGTYTLTETIAPTGFGIAENITFVVDEEGKVTVNGREVDKVLMEDKKQGYTFIQLTKIDSVWGSRPLSGAEFEIRTGPETTVKLEDGTEIGPDQVIIEKIVSDENGVAKSSDVLPIYDINGEKAKYYYVETKAPEDYMIIGSPIFPIEAEENGIIREVGNLRNAYAISINKIIGLHHKFEGKITFEIEIKNADGEGYNGSFYYVDLYKDPNINSDEGSRDVLRDDENDVYNRVEFVDGIGTIEVDGNCDITIYDIPREYNQRSVKEVDSSEYYSIYGERRPAISIYDFYNINKPEEVKFNLEADKTLIGKELTADEFEFVVKDKDGEEVARTTNKADGSIVFEDIEINPDDLQSKKLTYATASDDQKEAVDIWIIDAEDAPYSATGHPIYFISKNIDADAVPEDKSSFSNPDVTYGTATNEEKRAYQGYWEEIETYGLAPYNNQTAKIAYFDANYVSIPDNAYVYVWEGELEYTISEVIPDNPDSNTTYDEHSEKVTVTVTHNLKDNKLEADVDYEDEDVTFENETKAEVEISKVKVGGSDELPGATLKITDENEDLVEQWVSTTESKKVNLSPGTYTLTETRAPKGYEVAEAITFVVDDQGKVTVGGQAVTKILMEDKESEKFDVEISKTVINGTAELPGALLRVTDEDGETIEEWTSTNETHTVKLIEGTYTLTEIRAPEGYEIAESITFVVDDQGKVTIDGTEVNKVVMQDKEIEEYDIEVSKVDLGGKELPGAKINLYDDKGNVIESWTSTNTTHKLKLEAGNYSLKEVVAPVGYDLITTTIQFSVNKNGSISLKAVNDVKVKGNTIIITNRPTRKPDKSYTLPKTGVE